VKVTVHVPAIFSINTTLKLHGSNQSKTGPNFLLRHDKILCRTGVGKMKFPPTGINSGTIRMVVGISHNFFCRRNAIFWDFWGKKRSSEGPSPARRSVGRTILRFFGAAHQWMPWLASFRSTGRRDKLPFIGDERMSLGRRTSRLTPHRMSYGKYFS